MVHKVLLVDDDRVLLRMLQTKLEPHRQRFTLLVAENGLQALTVLRSECVSLVVSDLQMPEMDGLELLAHMSEHYPDIPVIVQTAHDTPRNRRSALASGAVEFIQKPVHPGNLADNILAMLEKEADGGTLCAVPLELFCRLIEMEQKTCILRVHRKEGQASGVLFFRKGQLFNARVNEMKGRPAALEIFSWKNPVYSIQHGCTATETAIDCPLEDMVPE